MFLFGTFAIFSGKGAFLLYNHSIFCYLAIDIKAKKYYNKNDDKG